MNHWKARRWLADLPDHSLPAPLEARVRAHAEGCGRCRRVLSELEAGDRLLAQLPTALVPLAPARERADGRLRALARWAAAPTPSRQERLGLSALGAFAVAATLALVLSSLGWAPPTQPEPTRPLALAGVLPDTELLPMGRWR